MIKRFSTVFIAAVMILSLAACSGRENTADKDKLAVYYINRTSYESGGSRIQSVDYYLDSSEDMINNALDYLSAPPDGSQLETALVKGTRIYSYELEDGVIDVALSPAYLMLTELEKAIIKCCLTLTMCGIAEVEYLNIYVDGKLVEEKLDERAMIIEDIDTNEFEKRICLYFPDSNNNYLHTEYRVLTVGQDVSIAEYVVEELIKSTQSEGLCASVPAEVRLLSTELKNGVCTVNFSKEFIDNRPETAAGQRLTIYSVVNSLCEQDNIDVVRFRVEGKDAGGYEYINIGDDFTAFDDIVYYPDEVSQLFTAVYLGNTENGKMIRTPVIIDKDSQMSDEENIVRYVLTLGDIGGYERLIPGTVELIGMETANGVCTIDLTRGLFGSGDSKVATLASCAIAASVIDSGAANRVTVTVEGKKYLENITQYVDLIIE